MTTMAIPPLFFIIFLTPLSSPTPPVHAEAVAKHNPGICYGTLSDDLPSPDQVVKMLISNNITRVRIYNPDPTIMSSLSHTSIQLTIGLPNEEIPAIATNQTHAHLWLAQYISPFATSLLIRRITVGNEYVDPNSITAPKDMKSIHDAIVNIQTAVSAFGLANTTEVSTVIHMALLASSFPPSNGTFVREIAPGMGEIAKLLIKNKASLLVNVYPYFAYIEDTIDIPLSYALFMSMKRGVGDGNVTYWNLLDAMVEAVHAALRRVGGGGAAVVVGETGWPTKGNRAATVENARTYNENLGRHVDGAEVYIFAMFDEDRKKRGVERRWGVFNADMSAKYNLSFYGGTVVKKNGKNGTGVAASTPVVVAPSAPPLHSPFQHLNSSFSVRGLFPPGFLVLMLLLLLLVSVV